MPERKKEGGGIGCFTGGLLSLAAIGIAGTLAYDYYVKRGAPQVIPNNRPPNNFSLDESSFPPLEELPSGNVDFPELPDSVDIGPKITNISELLTNRAVDLEIPDGFENTSEGGGIKTYVKYDKDHNPEVFAIVVDLSKVNISISENPDSKCYVNALPFKNNDSLYPYLDEGGNFVNGESQWKNETQDDFTERKWLIIRNGEAHIVSSTDDSTDYLKEYMENPEEGVTVALIDGQGSARDGGNERPRNVIGSAVYKIVIVIDKSAMPGKALVWLEKFNIPEDQMGMFDGGSPVTIDCRTEKWIASDETPLTKINIE